MGRRKLRFDIRKNQERKQQRKRPLNLIMSIPLQLLPTRECVVSIPICIYTSAVISNSAVLQSCLSQLSILPDRWKCECLPSWTGFDLVFTKLSTVLHHCLHKFLLRYSESILYIIKSSCSDEFSFQVLKDCTWCLKVGEALLDLTCCSLLKSLPTSLSTVDAIMNVMHMLDSSKQCTGNDDEDFSRSLIYTKTSLKITLGAQVYCYFLKRIDATIFSYSLQEKFWLIVTTVVLQERLQLDMSIAQFF